MERKGYELALVMPVYNEEECIVDVAQGWHDQLSGLDIDFRMFILNDGSRDNTGRKLAAFDGSQRIRIINKENTGHGPTILSGYRMAVDEATWVFQTDSDNEMSPASFEQLWRRRASFDALFGYRQARQQPAARKLITAASGFTIRLLFPKGVTDVNTPYRLMRTSLLKGIVLRIPDDTFAPNVIISGALAASGARIYNHPVLHESRKTGKVSIVKWKLWRAAVRSFVQTVKFRVSDRDRG